MTRNNPWHITEAEAAARDQLAIEQEQRAFLAVCKRVIAPEMPDDHIMFRLASFGYSAADIRRLTPPRR